MVCMRGAILIIDILLRFYFIFPFGGSETECCASEGAMHDKPSVDVTQFPLPNPYMPLIAQSLLPLINLVTTKT